MGKIEAGIGLVTGFGLDGEEDGVFAGSVGKDLAIFEIFIAEDAGIDALVAGVAGLLIGDEADGEFTGDVFEGGEGDVFENFRPGEERIAEAFAVDDEIVVVQVAYGSAV